MVDPFYTNIMHEVIVNLDAICVKCPSPSAFRLSEIKIAPHAPGEKHTIHAEVVSFDEAISPFQTNMETTNDYFSQYLLRYTRMYPREFIKIEEDGHIMFDHILSLDTIHSVLSVIMLPRLNTTVSALQEENEKLKKQVEMLEKTIFEDLVPKVLALQYPHIKE
jgi:hypothetical protein